jgi:hypothetical protein
MVRSSVKFLSSFEALKCYKKCKLSIIYKFSQERNEKEQKKKEKEMMIFFLYLSSNLINNIDLLDGRVKANQIANCP